MYTQKFVRYETLGLNCLSERERDREGGGREGGGREGEGREGKRERDGEGGRERGILNN